MTPAERALGAVGARFRLHGRAPATGLDCVGLAALAYGREDAPTGYRLRGGSADEVVRALGDGFVPADGARPSDLLLFRPGPGQLHLGVRTDAGFVHADAGLGRVVERPGRFPWPLAAAWRREG